MVDCLKMVIFSLLIVCLMLMFTNVLFYTVSLLLLSLSILLWLVSSNYVSTLLIILITIVYVGAIIILIGYICAVCPNLIITPSNRYFYFILRVVVLLSARVLNYSVSYGLESAKSRFLLDYLFRDWGILMFILIVFMLFFTLLIVTSQYNSPQGPFRSN